MSWRVADSLDTLLDEINTAAPHRSKISDGSIGDAAHASRSSDHNPWVIDRNGIGVVRARDFTHDPANGCDAGAIAEAVRQLGLRGDHPALGAGAYVIWNRRIASATQDGQPWDWEPYSGSNPHDKHCHVSVATAAAGYDSTARWGVMEEEDEMAQYDELLKGMDRKLDRVLTFERASRDRERQIRRRLVVANRQLDELEESTADDATKTQVRRIRADLGDLADTLGSDSEAGDGDPRP